MRKLRVLLPCEHRGRQTPSSTARRRLLQPLSHPSMADGFEVVVGDETTYRSADVVVVDPMWNPRATAHDVLHHVEAIRQAGASLIYAIDDNLLDCAAVSIERKAVAGLLAREADGLIVPTEPLKERLLPLNQNIEVVPEAIDERLFQPALRRRFPWMHVRRRLSIGFLDTFSPVDDLRMIAAALRSFIERNRERVELHLAGSMDGSTISELFGDLPVKYQPLSPDDMSYPRFVAKMISGMRFDIGVAPLQDNRFGRCRSDIQYLTYAAQRIASVFSNVPPYDGSVRHLETGYLVENTPEAWEQGLQRLLDDEPLRRRMASNAQADVFSQRTLARCAGRWRDAIGAINDRNVSRRRDQNGGRIPSDQAGVVDVDLILGVHNEPHLTAQCIESLLANTSYPHWRLLIIDDQSDALTSAMLNHYAARHSNIVVHRNETNLGFVGTYNRGVGLARAKYVVFLNSDIILPPGWLGRLVEVAESDPTIALVNPLSNEAANLSVPMAPGATCFSVDHLLQTQNDRVAFDIVTAIGFCLLVRREALERHGALDDTFGRGYCEDSDLHMRLTSNGWRSVAAANTYVYHLGSGTFSSAVAKQRFEQNITVFMDRWRTRWLEDLERFCEEDPISDVRRLFQIETPPVPPPLPTRKEKAMAALRVVVSRRRKIASAVFHPQRVLQKLQNHFRHVAPPPSKLPPPPPIDVASAKLPREYLERQASRDMPSAIFILEGLHTCGGCLRVVELANQLILMGVNARVAVCNRGEFDPQSVRGALFVPMLFDNRQELIDNLPHCDVVVATLWSTAAYARQLVDAGRAQTAFHFVQDFEPWFYETADEQQRVLDHFPLVDNRVATSHWLQGLLREHGHESRVIPLGFDAFRFYRRSIERTERLRIIAMARPETPRRGFEDLAETFRRVHRRRPEVEFALFGSSSLAKHGNLGFPFIDLGVIRERNQLCREYSSADIFIDTSRFQGFGLPALEAMACNLACVLTDVGGVHEYARDERNALMVPACSPEACCDAVVRLIDDRPLRIRLSGDGRKTIEQMPLREEAEAWLRAFTDACPAFQPMRDKPSEALC